MEIHCPMVQRAEFGQDFLPQTLSQGLGHLWNSNYQSGNPFESVDIHFLALFHTCGDMLKSWDIFPTHFPPHALTLGLPW
jgi:hypothetical protein